MVPFKEIISKYETGTAPDDASGVPAVDRALDVLELLAAAPNRLTLSEIIARLNLPKGSAHRLLATLKARGYVEQRGGRGGYGLGGRLVALAARSQGQWDVARAAHDPMRRLAALTGEGCQLSVRGGDRALCVARVAAPSHPEVTLMGGVGSSFPLHAVAVGKALLAFAPPAEQTTYLATPLESFTPDTITDPDRLREELAQIARDGMARDAQEYKRGLRAVAAPIFSADSGPVAVAALALPLLVAASFNAAEEARIEATLRECAGEISRALGGRDL